MGRRDSRRRDNSRRRERDGRRESRRGRSSRSRGRDSRGRDSKKDRDSKDDYKKSGRGDGAPTDQERKLCSMLVRGLSKDVPQEELKKTFEEFGEVKDCYIPLDYWTKEPKGFGFVQFAEATQAETAIKEMNGESIGGQAVQCVIAERGRRSPGSMKDLESRRKKHDSRKR